MEIYVMKKKFVLTLALVLLVVVGLSAATPVTVSGEFKAGYTLTFASSATTVAVANDDGTNAAYASDFAVSADFWKLTYAVLSIDGDASQAASAEIYLDKALAAQGVDMGDLTITLGVGNKSGLKAKDVYTDTNDEVAELAMVGTEAMDVTVGYGTLASVYLGVVPTDTADKPFVASVCVYPVDGIKASFGYTNKTASGTKGGITGSATVDVAALTGLGFGLKTSALAVYDLNTEVTNLYGEVNGSYDVYSAWVEYQLLNKQSNIEAKVSYAGIENVGLYGKLEITDITDLNSANETAIGAGTSYSMGGVKYALDVTYKVVAASFAITPSCFISF